MSYFAQLLPEMKEVVDYIFIDRLWIDTEVSLTFTRSEKKTVPVITDSCVTAVGFWRGISALGVRKCIVALGTRDKAPLYLFTSLTRETLHLLFPCS